jgi:hypothetical protein
MTVSGYPAAGDGMLRITWTTDPPGLAIAGDIDESSYDELVTALAETADWPDDEVHVNMAAVTYCDLAGLRAIIAVTTGSGGPGDSQQSPQPGIGRRRVILHAVQPELKAVLRILGWDTVPGLVVSEDGGRRAGYVNGTPAGRARGSGGR